MSPSRMSSTLPRTTSKEYKFELELVAARICSIISLTLGDGKQKVRDRGGEAA